MRIFFKLLLALSCFIYLGYAEPAQPKMQHAMPDMFFTVVPNKIKSNMVTGNPNGSITIIDVYDYNCFYCKILAHNLNEIVKANPQIRWIHLPVGVLTGSQIEAKYAIAANELGKFEVLDRLMMKSLSPLTETQILDLAQKNGVDPKLLKAKAHSEETSDQLLDIYAASFGISEIIPVLIIGKSTAPSHGILMVGASNDDIIKQISRLSKP